LGGGDPCIDVVAYILYIAAIPESNSKATPKERNQD
jgi:hypothetical protein